VGQFFKKVIMFSVVEPGGGRTGSMLDLRRLGGAVQSTCSTEKQPLSPYVRVGLVFVAIVVAETLVMFGLGYTQHIETLKVVAGSLSNLVGTVVGACLGFWFAGLQSKNQSNLAKEVEREKNRLQLAFDMHREFASENMLKARDDADALLNAFPNADYRSLFRSHPTEKTRCLFVVADFYDRLSLAVAYDRIDTSLVPELFGFYFVWWWLDVFEKRFVAPDPDSPESRRIASFHTWLKTNAGGDLYQKWIKERQRSIDLVRAAATPRGTPIGEVRPGPGVRKAP
jgi:hypothetical protein